MTNCARRSRSRARFPKGGWRGHSDVEVFLEGIAAWGLTEALRRSVGMFAFGLWDRKERTLSLVRDRFGEKPLYYGWAGKDFLFGSELKVLRAHPRFGNAIDRRALKLFAARTYIPAPLSIYERVFKLPPGCVLTVTAQGAGRPRTEPPEEGKAEDGLSLTRYWSYRDVIRRGLGDPIPTSSEALAELEEALARAIDGQSMADVPVGAFLSGGIDSSTIVGLYQKYSSIPVRTFSIGFEDDALQRGRARQGRRRASRNRPPRAHRDRARDARRDPPAAGDVRRAVRRQLADPDASGQPVRAGAGHRRPDRGRRRRIVRRLQPPLRRAAPVAAIAEGSRSRCGRRAGRRLANCRRNSGAGSARFLPGRRQAHFGGKVQKALRVAASARNFDEVYCSFLDEWSHEPSPVLGGGGSEIDFDLDIGADAPDAVRMMYCDGVSYLPDDILAKVDRASMAVALETRVPFLDHRVAELAARIPLDMKVRGGRGKHIVRELLYGLVPRALVERPKAGFGIPVGQWIKGPLRPWAEDLLDPGKSSRRGLVRRRRRLAPLARSPQRDARFDPGLVGDPDVPGVAPGGARQRRCGGLNRAAPKPLEVTLR